MSDSMKHSPADYESPLDAFDAEVLQHLSAYDVFGHLDRYEEGYSEAKACCPFHDDNNPSMSINMVSLLWHCHGCGEGGNVTQFVMKEMDVEWKDAVLHLADMAGVDADVLFSRTPVRSASPQHRKASEPPKRLPKSEVHRVWYAGSYNHRDKLLAGWARHRGIDPRGLRGLAKLVPDGLPDWASHKAAWWNMSGHRLMVPMYDATGELVSLHARCIVKEKRYANYPKGLSPAGASVKGLVMANPNGVAMLKGESAPTCIIIVEGVPDYLTWASLLSRRRYTVFGIISGSFTESIAARIPDGARVVIRTDNDEAGAKYATTIRKFLGNRCRLYRGGVGDAYKDDNERLVASVLPDDPFEGAAELPPIEPPKPKHLSHPYDGQPASDEEQAAARDLMGQVEQDHLPGYFITLEKKALDVARFKIIPKQRVLHRKLNGMDEERLVVDIRTPTRIHKDVQIKSTDWSSKQQFLRALPADCVFTGSDANLQAIRGEVYAEDIPTVHGTPVIGYHELDGRGFWVTPDRITHSGEVDPTDTIRFISEGDPVAGRIHMPTACADDLTALNEVVYATLPIINTPQVMLPIIGWYFATPFKERWSLTRVAGRFPILGVVGSQSCGKTSTMAETMQPLFGFESGNPFGCTPTKFAWLRLLSSTNGVPVAIDEVKKSDMKHQDYDLLVRNLRKVYGGEVDLRGNQDQSTSSYRLCAPVVVSGETGIDVAAVRERSLNVIMAAPTLKEKRYEAAYKSLHQHDLGAFAEPYIRWTLEQDATELFNEGKRAADSVLARMDVKPPHRVRHNLAVMMAGWTAFRNYGASLGLEKSIPDIDTDLESIFRSLLEIRADGTAEVRNSLDAFIEELATLVYRKLIRNRGSLVYYIVDNGYLYINFKACYQTFREYIRGRERDFDDIGESGLRRLVRESKMQGGYVVDPSVQKWVPKKQSQGHIAANLTDGRNIRTVQISLAKAMEYGLDLDGFGLSSTPDEPVVTVIPEGTNVIALPVKPEIQPRRRRRASASSSRSGA